MATKKSVKKAKPLVKKVAIKKVTTSSKVKASDKPQAKAIGKITKPLTKSELYTSIGNSLELSRKQVASIFEQLGEIVALHLKKDGPEQFVLPGLLKIKVKKVPARPARKGKNPFTGEMVTFKAKPASKKVKIIALRALKGMV